MLAFHSSLDAQLVPKSLSWSEAWDEAQFRTHCSALSCPPSHSLPPVVENSIVRDIQKKITGDATKQERLGPNRQEARVGCQLHSPPSKQGGPT
jgi:hypothetical protein